MSEGKSGSITARTISRGSERKRNHSRLPDLPTSAFAITEADVDANHTRFEAQPGRPVRDLETNLLGGSDDRATALKAGQRDQFLGGLYRDRRTYRDGVARKIARLLQRMPIVDRFPSTYRVTSIPNYRVIFLRLKAPRNTGVQYSQIST